MEFIKDIHYYLEEGKVIFTTLYHIQRGECCGNKCRHCPYDPLYVKGNNSLQEHFLEKLND
jgi:hypothetical protein